MMRKAPFLLVLLGLCSSLGCQKQPDRQQLQGTWAVTSYTVDGKAAPKEITSQVVIVIEGDKSTLNPGVVFSPDGFEIDKAPPQPSTFTLGEGATPTIDFRVELDKETVTVRGIYLLDGDTLRICTNFSGKEGRPTEFTSTPGSRQSLFVLKRKT